MTVLKEALRIKKFCSFHQPLAYINQPKTPTVIVGYDTVTSNRVLWNGTAEKLERDILNYARRESVTVLGMWWRCGLKGL